MESALAWIGELARWIAAWFPRLVIIKANHQMIKFVHGKDVKVIDPGLAFYWPLVTIAKSVFVGRSVMNLTSQTLTTKDGKVLLVSGVIAYTIDDIVQYEVENWNAEHSIDDIALASIKQVVTASTYEELLSEQSDLDDKLTDHARESLTFFGIDVEYVRLTDFAQTRALSISGVSFQTNSTVFTE